MPTDDGIRFLTGYDCRARSRVADLVIRPLIGWATAWSFDRLRLRLETGQSPERSLRQALAEAAVRAGTAAAAAVLAPLPVLAATLDATGRFTIDVAVVNRAFGPLFGYQGSFTTRYVDATLIPAGIRPSRQESRV